MSLRAEILKEHSKAQAEKIAAWVGNDAIRFVKLVHLFLQDVYRVVQRTAWILSIVAEKHPELLQPHLEQIVNRMNEPNLPVAVKRNVVRILQHISIPETLHAAVLNGCFQFLVDPKETIAVRCFSMTVLSNLAATYTDIKDELITAIEDQLEHEPSAGFKSRARKVLAKLSTT